MHVCVYVCVHVHTNVYESQRERTEAMAKENHVKICVCMFVRMLIYDS